jgi:hypothetical protein
VHSFTQRPTGSRQRFLQLHRLDCVKQYAATTRQIMHPTPPRGESAPSPPAPAERRRRWL